MTTEKRLTIPQAKKLVGELQALGHTAAFNRMGDGKMTVHIYENSEWGMVATRAFGTMADFERFTIETAEPVALTWICYECQGYFLQGEMTFDGGLGFCSGRCWDSFHTRGKREDALAA